MKTYVAAWAALAATALVPVTAAQGNLSVTEIGQFEGPAIDVAFGRDLYLDGDTLGVTRGSTSSQSLRVYVRTGGAWEEQALLFIDDNRVALRGDTILAGAPSSFFGSVRWFERTGSTWSQKVIGPPAIAGQFADFGSAVAIDDGEDEIAISDSSYEDAFASQGAVFLYERSGSSWVLRDSLFGYGEFSRFGRYSLGFRDDTLLVSHVDGLAHYERVGGVWTLVNADVLGGGVIQEIEMDGPDTAVVWQPGQIWVLTRSGGEFVVQAVLNDPGSGIDVDGGILVTEGQGAAVRLYSRNLGWQQMLSFIAQDTQPGDVFGSGVGIEGSTLMIGAQGAEKVYEFAIAVDPALVYCEPKQSADGCSPKIGFAGTPGLTEPGPFDVLAVDLPSNKTGLLFYGIAGPLSAPMLGGTLCVQPPLRRTVTQPSGGNPPPPDCSGTFALDFNALVQSGVDPNLVSGQAIHAQYTHRDPQDPAGAGLSDAVTFTIGP